MVLTAGFYCDSRAHHVWKHRVVKYIVVFSQIKAADQKFATTKDGDENSKKFGDNLGQVIHGSLHIDSLICYLLYLVYHYISYVYPCLP